MVGVSEVEPNGAPPRAWLDWSSGPTLDEVLPVRDVQALELEHWLAAVTFEQL